MMVFRSPCRPRMQPSHPDPFEGPRRNALAQAKRRRLPVTLPTIGFLADVNEDRKQSALTTNGGRHHG